MRIPLLMLPVLASGSLAAQCTFTPSIAPASPILCPNATEVLSTQLYDSYQWFKDGAPVPGATGQTFTVSSADVGSMIAVQATQDSCTELSSGVLVDGYIFLLPYVISAGDPPFIDSLANVLQCAGDTVLLIMGSPNTANVQWTNNGVPIPGATDDTLVVTTTGSYSASGAPVVCPNYIQQLGVNIDLTFITPTVPTIVPNGTQLCASPLGTGYQWYLNGNLVPGATNACLAPGGPGSYTVEVDYNEPCSTPSAPYLITGIDEDTGSNGLQLFPNPTRGAIRISRGQGGPTGNWDLVDGAGRSVLEGRFRGFGDEWLDLSGLPQGRYWLRPQLGADWAPAAITVID